MLKLGIVPREQLSNGLGRRGRKRFVNALLLKELARSDRSEADNYNAIIRRIMTGGGVWKETCAGRFSSLDRLVLECLQGFHAPEKRLDILDLAASSGTTSVELFNLLRSAFPLDFVATDLCWKAYAFRFNRVGCTVVLDGDGVDLQYVLGGFVLPGQGYTEPVFYPVNRLLRHFCRRFLLPRARAAMERCRPEGHLCFETAGAEDFEVTALPLLSLECIEAMRCHGNFRFETADITKPLGCRAQLVRAMNILTPRYLGERQLRSAIRNCLEAVDPEGGVLVLGTTPTGREHRTWATLYRRAGGQLLIVQRTHGGFEHEGLVDLCWAEFQPLAKGA